MRERPLRRRRDRERRALPRPQGRALDDPRQAPRRDGAARSAGTTTSSTASPSGARGVSMFVTHYATTAPPLFEGTDGPSPRCASGTAPLVEACSRRAATVARGQVDSRARPARRLPDPRRPRPRARRAAHAEVIGFQPYELAEGPERWDDAEGRGLRGEPRLPAPLRAEPDRRRDPRDAWSSARSTSRPEPAQLARLVPRRRHGPGAVAARSGRCRAGRSTGCRSPASTRPARPRIPAARSRARPAATRRWSCSGSRHDRRGGVA